MLFDIVLQLPFGRPLVGREKRFCDAPVRVLNDLAVIPGIHQVKGFLDALYAAGFVPLERVRKDLKVPLVEDLARLDKSASAPGLFGICT